jgi:hypothetical protein
MLNVTETGISYEGQKTLLVYLSKNRPNLLENYACDGINSVELDILVNLFPNIEQLSVGFTHLKGPVTTTGIFYKMKVLKIENFEKDSFEQLLRFVPHLVELELTGFDVSLSEIMSNCSTLKRLSLRAHHIRVYRTTAETYR